MLDLLLTSTSTADPTGANGLVQTPYTWRVRMVA